MSTAPHSRACAGVAHASLLSSPLLQTHQAHDVVVSPRPVRDDVVPRVWDNGKNQKKKKKGEDFFRFRFSFSPLSPA